MTQIAAYCYSVDLDLVALFPYREQARVDVKIRTPRCHQGRGQTVRGALGREAGRSSRSRHGRGQAVRGALGREAEGIG